MMPKQSRGTPTSSPLARRASNDILKEHEEIMMHRIDSMALGEKQELADRLLAWEALISPSRDPSSKPPVGSRGKKKRQSLSVRRSSILERFNSSRKHLDSPKDSHSSFSERRQLDFDYGATSAPVSKKKTVRDVTGFSKASGRVRNSEVDHTSNSSRSGRSLILLAPDLSVDDDDDRSGARRRHNRRDGSSSPVTTSSNRGRRHRRWSINGYGVRNTSPRPPSSSAATTSPTTKTTAQGHHSLSTMDFVSGSRDHDNDRNLPHNASDSATTSAKVKIASAKARQKLKSNRRKHVDQSLNRFAQHGSVDCDSDRYSTLSSSVHESPGGGGKKGWYNSFHESLKGSITGPTRKKKSLRDVLSPRRNVAKSRGDRENSIEVLPLPIPYLNGENGDNEIRKGSSSTRSSSVHDRTTTPTRMRKHDSKRVGGRSSTESDLPPMLPF